MADSLNELLKDLPRVDDLMQTVREQLPPSELPYSEDLIGKASRAALEHERTRLRSAFEGSGDKTAASAADHLRPLSAGELAHGVVRDLIATHQMTLKPVINASGVVIHTNLGRSVLPEKAALQVYNVARGYSNLEFNLDEGVRGSRHDIVEDLLCELTGAQAACVVNNNAAAVLLVLTEFARGSAALVSRGELIEIGGSFRIPDIMRLSGAEMIEVGTTNKTHLSDFERAYTDDVSLILKVHPSNYRIVGFTEQVEISALKGSEKLKDILLYEDQGSGVLVDLARYELPHERTVSEALGEGVDIVSCSGDKLLGASQAGLIFGSYQLIERIKKNPMMRALRPDKLTLAGLEMTLRLYRDENVAVSSIPTLRMLTQSHESLLQSAQQLADMVCSELTKQGISTSNHPTEGASTADGSGRSDQPLIRVWVQDEVGRAGGGALPTVDLPGAVVCVDTRCLISTSSAQRKLLTLTQTPLVTRVVDDCIALDPRTLLNKEEYLRAAELLGILLDSVS